MNQQYAAQLSDWLDSHFDRLTEDLKKMIRIPSVARYDDPDTPYGPACTEALDTFLKLAESYGFAAENVNGRCGTVSLRPGTDEICAWCHLDVVPAGDDWTLTDAYTPIVKDGWLIGRGGGDNKGPAVGVLYVLRALQELNIPTRYGLRLCVGCDEEHGMSDVDDYVRCRKAAALNLVADGGFPVGYAEKGILDAEIVSAEPMTCVKDMTGGHAHNIIPALARARLAGTEEERIYEGRSGHSAHPEGTVNAIHRMTEDLLRVSSEASERQVLSFFHRINDDWHGQALGVQGSDAGSGDTTCVGTMIRMREDGRAVLHVNIRYHVKADSAALIEAMRSACAENGCTLEHVTDSRPNDYPRESPVVDALTDVFNRMTGEQRQPFVMSGGTYARRLPNAVAFGLGGLTAPQTDLFQPGHGGAHQPDEGTCLENLKKALLIFAMGLLEADRVLTEAQ